MGGFMYEFKDLTRVTTVAVTAVAIYLMTDILTSSAMLALGPSAPDEFGLVDWLGVPQFIAVLTAYFVVGRWIYRASANAHAITDEMIISPGWAVGWYFVPFANLVKPFQAMKEIWLASHRAGAGYEPRGSAILGWWWGLWLLSNMLGNASFRMEMRDGTDPQTLTTLYLVSTAINIPLSILLIMIMREIANAQRGGIYEEVFA